MIHLLHVLKQISSLFKQCDGLLITAGAGMGVDGGLPDFRSNNGFWNEYPFLQEKHLSFRDIASPEGFRTYPLLAAKFYAHRHRLYLGSIPHTGYNILLEMGKLFEKGMFVVTSNVDGHFREANFPFDRLYEIHGNINFSQCSVPCTLDVFETEEQYSENITESNIPKCPHCGKQLRPNILLFNDGAWIDTIYAQQEIRFNNWTKSCKQILCIEIGAGTAIQSIRMISEEYHRTLIRINPKDYITPYRNGVSLPVSGLLGIQLIDFAIKSKQGA